MASSLFLLVLSMMIISESTMGDPAHAGQRLIKPNPNEPAKWMSNEELEAQLHVPHHFGFMDLTRKGEDTGPPKGRAAAFLSYPTQPTQQKVVRELFPHVQKERMESFIKKLSSFHSRHAKNYSGDAEAEGWLFQEISTILAEYTEGASSIRTVAFIPDPRIPWLIDYTQKNIIVKLDGQDPSLKDELIILGAHYDSINKKDQLNEKPTRAPGADDNASGCAVLLEVLRIITQFGIKLKHGLELHWYTAEERGLLGSQDVVTEYKNKVKVKAMLNLDVVGYQSQKLGRTIAWWKGSTNEQLMTFVKMIIGEYSDYELKQGYCEVWCSSDHASWFDAGFPAAFVSEAEFTPHLHSDGDTAETVNYDQVHEFAKIALAFVIELSESPPGAKPTTEPSSAPVLGAEWSAALIGA